MEIFLHIPKCGGFTIYKLFYDCFDSLLRVGSSEGIRESDFSNYDLNDYDAVLGHLRYETMIKNPTFHNQDAIIHSIIREPIDRIISTYNFIVSNERHFQHTNVSNIDGEDFVMNYSNNFQARFLGYGVVHESLEDLTQAVNLCTTESSVEYFCKILSDKSDNVLKSTDVEIENITKKRFKKNQHKFIARENFTHEQIEKLKIRNKINYALYKEACESVI